MELIKCTNIGLELNDGTVVPVIRAVIADGAGSYTEQEINNLLIDIVSRSAGFAVLSAYWTRVADAHVAIENDTYIYGSGDEGARLRFSVSTNGREQNISTSSGSGATQRGLFINGRRDYIFRVRTGYSDYEYSPAIIFTDEDYHIYRVTSSAKVMSPSIRTSFQMGISGRNNIPVALISPDGEYSIIGESSSVTLAVGDSIEDIIKNEIDPTNTDPYAPGGESGTGGGTGTFSDTGDVIGEPSLPTLSAVDTGFIQLFSPTLAQLNSLASKLWSNDFFENFVKAFENPMDVILGLSIVPVAVPTSGAREVTAGNINTNVQMNVASTQYVRVPCGSLNVLEFWGSYLDYNPYTKFWIYLPYIGIKPLDSDVVMNHNVEVTYHIDLLSGACVAMIFSDGTQVATWAGQCSSLIPVNAQNYSNLFSGLLGSVAGIGTTLAGALTGNPAMVGAGALGAFASATSIAKIDCEKSGTINSTAGMLSVQSPYLIVERPKQAVPFKQNAYTGYPSFITATLGELSGYTEVAKIHLNNIPATDEELIEIDKLLKEGVII